jgi:hypothetical protein
MKGLGDMHVTHDPGRGGVSEGAAGTYWHGEAEGPAMSPHWNGGKGMPAQLPEIGVRPDYVKSTTPIHELGHHADPGIEAYSTPAEKGHAEGFADAYADKHARSGGYKQKSVKAFQNELSLRCVGAAECGLMPRAWSAPCSIGGVLRDPEDLTVSPDCEGFAITGTGRRHGTGSTPGCGMAGD